MNIFTSDLDPLKAAYNLDDRRAIKLVLESAQLLSTALRVHAPDVSFPKEPYKLCHQNHPCAIWARQSTGNYDWLLSHFTALCRVYRETYYKTHASLSLLQTFVRGHRHIPIGDLMPFVNCTNDPGIGANYQHLPDTVLAYRHYLAHKWQRENAPVRFRNHTIPEWLPQLTDPASIKWAEPYSLPEKPAQTLKLQVPSFL